MNGWNPCTRRFVFKFLIETKTLRIAVLEVQIAGCQALLLTLAQGGHPRRRRRPPHRDGRRARASVA